MPRNPILYREALYDIRDGKIRFLDWNRVDTSIGAMTEARQLNTTPIGDEFVDRDLTDLDIDKMSMIDEDKMFSLFLHSGRQLPVDHT